MRRAACHYRDKLHFRAARRLCWPVLLLLPLILVACSESGLLPEGFGNRGESLSIILEEIHRLEEIRYEGTDKNHYLLAPTSKDNEFITLRLDVHNVDASSVLLTLDEEASELRGFGTNETFKPLDVYLNSVQVAEAHPTENLYVPFLAGSIEMDGVPGLPQDHSVIGWVVFEVPKGTRLRELKWTEGDTVYLKSGNRPPEEN